MNDSIPLDQRQGSIWFDGKFVDWSSAKIHVLTHGLHYASSVFEGVRSYKGKVFKAREHADRLHFSATMLGITIPYSLEIIAEATQETVDKNGGGNQYIRPFAWCGSEGLGMDYKKCTVHIAIASWPMEQYYPDSLYEDGLKLQLSRWKRPAPDTAPSTSKAAGLYMISFMSKKEALKLGYNDALLLDTKGQIAEASVANFFMVKDGALWTPPPDCILNGITRQTVISLAKNAKIPVHETHFKLEDLTQAEEAFLTGTAAELIPIRSVENYNFTIPGPISQKLRASYQELVHA